jgi:hypothetical protein
MTRPPRRQAHANPGIELGVPANALFASLAGDRSEPCFHPQSMLFVRAAFVVGDCDFQPRLFVPERKLATPCERGCVVRRVVVEVDQELRLFVAESMKNFLIPGIDGKEVVRQQARTPLARNFKCLHEDSLGRAFG